VAIAIYALARGQMKLEVSPRAAPAANHLQGNFYEIKEKPTD